MYRSFIFFRAGLASVSPVVTVWWPGAVLNLFRRFPPEALHFGSYASEACVTFITACAALDKTRYLPTEVSNLQLRWEGQDAIAAEFDTAAYRDQWRAWLLAEIDRLAAGAADPPILVDTDPPYHVTQGGVVLFQRHTGRDYQDGNPLWMTPAQATRLARAKDAAVRRRPKPTGMTVDEFEALLRDRLAAAGFDFGRPDRKVACRVVLALGPVPVACDHSFLYYEARDEYVEFGRWFQHGPDPRTARHERVALRLSSPKLRGYAFESAMGVCGGAPDDPKTFAAMLRKVFTAGPDRLVTRWHAALRRYDPR